MVSIPFLEPGPWKPELASRLGQYEEPPVSMDGTLEPSSLCTGLVLSLLS